MTNTCDHRPRLIQPLLRFLLLNAVLVGLLLPRMSAVIVEFLPNVMSVVICDGQRLVVWTIGPDGEPIEDIETTTHHCIMADGANDVATVIPHWHQLARTYAVLFTTRENARQSADHFAGLADTRGPPVLV